MKNLSSLGLKVENNQLFILDQRKLPREEVWVPSNTIEDTVSQIQSLAIRGAPLIGVAAAVSFALWVEKNPDAPRETLLKLANVLRNARPTAVNLMNAMDRMISSLGQSTAMAEKIFDEDVQLCERMADLGANLIQDGETILTHCNTGGLATVGLGTALSCVIRAHQNGKKVFVYVDETRPLLQGGRLTTWELKKHGIPFALIADNMAGYLMQKRKIHRVFLGADRIALNGDFANKVGTYSVAVLAKHHGVPFYTVAPNTTVDRSCLSGIQIPIEERDSNEITALLNVSRDYCSTFNPAFDVTPAELLTGIVLDTKVYSRQNLLNGELKRDFSAPLTQDTQSSPQ